ncbi:MAG: chromate efflux transporter [Acidobacteriota bacterium]|jgi:chromate transporter|nr:chromate efflux transporter [Acidobacteriota bacterium]
MEPAERNPSALNLDGGESVSLGRLLVAFLKIGSIGFGGGMAVIALMEQEFVRKRRLIPLDEFVHSVGLGQVLGSFAVNVAIFIGYRLFGVTGALLSAGAFLAPSIALVIILSDLYFRYHALPALQSAVTGLAPVVIALILGAGWSIGRKVLRSWLALLIGIGALLAGVAKLNTVWILLAAGAAGFLLSVRSGDPGRPDQSPKMPRDCAANLWSLALPAVAPISKLIVTFLKIGLVFFGGGFVLVPVLHDRLVADLGWLKPQEFLDGVAISNLTPGPIAVLATFAGYHMAGTIGALAATLALFAPGVILMLAISQQYGRFRDDQRAQRFLAGVNPAVAGLILSAALSLGWSTLVTWHQYLFMGLSLFLLLRLRWHPAFVLVIGAASGYVGLLP